MAYYTFNDEYSINVLRCEYLFKLFVEIFVAL